MGRGAQHAANGWSGDRLWELIELLLPARLGVSVRKLLSVLIHPYLWRRRVRIPGHEPFEIPTTSRPALEQAGFAITEDRRPSFVFQRSGERHSAGRARRLSPVTTTTTAHDHHAAAASQPAGATTGDSKGDNAAPEAGETGGGTLAIKDSAGWSGASRSQPAAGLIG